MNSICIIPARGGSKRIPRKNIKDFCGKPIIAYSIEVARQSGLFKKIVVSTDDEQIADVAKAYGAEVPFIRPSRLSDDIVGTSKVFLHALEWLEEHGISAEFACCIYATAPLLQVQYLLAGRDALKHGSANTAISVTSYPYSIFRSLKIDGKGYAEMFWPEYRKKRSQDMPEAYHDAGQFYWVRLINFILEPNLLGKQTKAIILPRWQVQDIDTQEDWTHAELLYQILRNG